MSGNLQLRIAVSLAGIVLLGVISSIGEELVSLGQGLYAKAPHLFDSLPALTRFVIQNYHVHEGHFLLSLTPFFGLLIVLPFLGHGKADRNIRFLYATLITWLVVMTYFCLFVYVLFRPMTHIGLAADTRVTMVTYIALAIDLLLLVLVGMYLRSVRRK